MINWQNEKNVRFYIYYYNKYASLIDAHSFSIEHNCLSLN